MPYRSSPCRSLNRCNSHEHSRDVSGFLVVAMACLLAKVANRPGFPVAKPVIVGYLSRSFHYDPGIRRVASVNANADTRASAYVVDPACPCSTGDQIVLAIEVVSNGIDLRPAITGKRGELHKVFATRQEFAELLAV